jgi:quercetin dioxygenase-like cupin family protein
VRGFVGIIMTPIRFALVCAGASLSVALAGQLPPGITRTEILDNANVLVARLRMAPNTREEVHTHPFSAVVVQIGAGEVDMRLGDARATSRRDHGHVEFIPRGMPHAAANAGPQPFDVVTIAVKPDRVKGGDAPASAAPAGITRTPVFDNPDARVTRVAFAPGSREPVHSHPFDLVLVQLSAGRVEVRLGDAVTAKDYEAGDVIYLPRDVPHAVSNVGTAAFDLYSIGVR